MQRLALQEPVETALLLSLSGVSCVVLNQWPCSLQQNALNAATVLDGRPDSPFPCRQSQKMQDSEKVYYLLV